MRSSISGSPEDDKGLEDPWEAKRRAPPAAAVEAVVRGAADEGGEADAVGVRAEVIVNEQRRIVQRERLLP